MNKLTIQKGNRLYEIIIDKYKLIVGTNYDEKFEIIRSILRFYSNNKLSEYHIEKDGFLDLKMNDKSIKVKDLFIYHVNKYYSLQEDYKLTTKSLILKYLETVLSDGSMNDTIQTLNILFESLSHEIGEESLIDGEFNDMIPKQLLKLFTPFFIEDGYKKDEFDFTIEEIIILQLNLIKRIVSNAIIKKSIIIVEINVLTKEIYEAILGFENSMILVFVDEFKLVDIPVSNFFICNRILVDLASDENLYEKICDNNFCLLTLEEGRDYMKNYLYKKDNNKTALINKLLK